MRTRAFRTVSHFAMRVQGKSSGECRPKQMLGGGWPHISIPAIKARLSGRSIPRVMKANHTASIRVREKSSATPLRLRPILRFGGTAIFSVSCLTTIGKNPPASRKLINGTITAAGWSICSPLRERCLTIGQKGRLCFRPIYSAIGAKMSCSAPRETMLCEYTQRPS